MKSRILKVTVYLFFILLAVCLFIILTVDDISRHQDRWEGQRHPVVQKDGMIVKPSDAD